MLSLEVTYHASFLILDSGSVSPIGAIIETTGIAHVVTFFVTSPKRRFRLAAIQALSLWKDQEIYLIKILQ